MGSPFPAKDYEIRDRQGYKSSWDYRHTLTISLIVYKVSSVQWQFHKKISEIWLFLSYWLNYCGLQGEDSALLHCRELCIFHRKQFSKSTP